MTIRFLMSSVVVLFFAGATLPAAALPVPFAGLAIPSTDTSDAFILVKKARGTGTAMNTSSGTFAITPTGFTAITHIHTAGAALTAIRASATIGAPEAATGT